LFSTTKMNGSLWIAAKFRAQLTEAGILTAEAEARITASITAAVDDATEYAESQPDPQPSTAMKWVYAEDWPSETPPAWGLGTPGEDSSVAEPSEPAGEGVH
jgi:hypothetical protein